MKENDLRNCVGGKHHSIWECLGGIGGDGLTGAAAGFIGGAAAGSVIPGIGTATVAGVVSGVSGIGGALKGATNHCG